MPYHTANRRIAKNGDVVKLSGLQLELQLQRQLDDEEFHDGDGGEEGDGQGQGPPADGYVVNKIFTIKNVDFFWIIADEWQYLRNPTPRATRLVRR